jgi:peptidoglycan lytic transglycosylase
VKRLLAVAALAAVAGGAFLYLRSDPTWFERLRYPLHYARDVRAQARRNHLDPALLAAVIYQESRFRSDARSSAGAIGLMQLTPSTARGIASRTGGSRFATRDLYDPEINIRYGAWYLASLFGKYRAEQVVLAAYNAGQGNVDRWRARGVSIQFPETAEYVKRVEHLERVYRRAWADELERR